MTTRVTLPAQRARETRQRILKAAEWVFRREGYGEAAVEKILDEAGISRGAFYHHFSGKEEVFKALLDAHLDEGFSEFAGVGPAGSLRAVIERFVGLLIEDMQAHLDSKGLPFEILAQATREEWARGPFEAFHRKAHDLVAEALRSGQRAGSVRSDLDVRAAAWLLLAVSEGLCTFKAIDPEVFDPEALAETWADLIERFVREQS